MKSSHAGLFFCFLHVLDPFGMLKLNTLPDVYGYIDAPIAKNLMLFPET